MQQESGSRTRTRSHAVSAGNASSRAALNSARRVARNHRRRVSAVTKIQAFARGRLARKRVAHLRSQKSSMKKSASPKRNSSKKPSSGMMKRLVTLLAASASLAPLMKMRVGSRYPSVRELQTVNAHPVRAARAVIPSASLAMIPGASVRNTPVYSLKGIRINNKVPNATVRSQATNQMRRNYHAFGKKLGNAHRDVMHTLSGGYF
jgi:hypothetical protein